MKNSADDFPIHNYIRAFPPGVVPWHFIRDISTHVDRMVQSVEQDSSYVVHNRIAIHKLAQIEENVVLKPPVFISASCFIASNAYLRGGTWLAEHVTIGPGTELKSTVVMDHAALAHFNFAGDSIIGSSVNMEAGSVITNHHNDREDKTIRIRIRSAVITLDVSKFGAIIGDGSKIGANAVLSPGTVLEPGSIIKRLELVEGL